MSLLVKQFVAVVATIAFSGVVTFIIAKAGQATIGLRVTDDDELRGRDLSQHAESAYVLGDVQTV